MLLLAPPTPNEVAGHPVHHRVENQRTAAASRKCQNRLYFGHLELICHRNVRFRREPKANGNGQISSSSKWPALARPSLAGFECRLTRRVKADADATR